MMSHEELLLSPVRTCSESFPGGKNELLGGSGCPGKSGKVSDPVEDARGPKEGVLGSSVFTVL